MGETQASFARISYRVHLLLLFSFVVYGEPGFMNIDCGKPRGYNDIDSLTGLPYVSDYDYIDTGVTHSIPSLFQGTSVASQAYDLRSFPNGTRNCYSLTPVSPGKKYLIRASFLYGNYDGKNYFPKFDLYLGTVYWETISISSSSVKYDTTIYSIASSIYMFVCLIDIGSGIPFISSLELRPLDDYIYSLEVNASNSISMVSVDLVSFGASTDPVIRYPQDAYDRVWRSYGEPGWTKLYTTFDIGVNDTFNPPLSVMQTAVAPASGSTLNFSIVLDDSSPNTLYHVFMHFAELQKLNQNAKRVFTISINDLDVYRNLRPEYLSISTMYFPNPKRYEKLDNSLYMTNGSTLPPTINAIEVYKIRESEKLTTQSEDAKAIWDIKAFYHIRKNWTGDPCAPRKFTWDGLVCSNDDSPRITLLNLRASGLTGPFRTSICNFTELQELDLSTNRLTGPIPSCLETLQQLTLLNLTSSGLKGPLPKALVDRSNNGSLELSFEDYFNPHGSSNQTYTSRAGRQKKSNVLIIAIATPISIVLLVLIVFGVFWMFRLHKHNKQHGPISRSENNQNIPPNQQSISPNNSDCRRFTHSELVKVTNNFSKIVGKGGFGSVYYGILPDKVPVAVKILSKASCQGPKEFQREAQLLTRIHHRNLVPFVGYCNDEGHLALVYEYMTQGDLATHLSGEAHVLCWRDRLRIATEAAQGLEYLHKHCAFTIIHRDIKTSNILLDQNLEAKIADFGLSRTCNNNNFTQVTTAIMGTRGYLDPFSVVLDERSDVYAFGIVLLELISGQPAIIQGAGCMCISDWVKGHYKRGDLDSIVDKNLQGYYNANSAWKALQTAMACVSPDTDGRPDMTMVLAALKECLEMASVNFTMSSNSNTTVRSNFTTDSFFPGNDSMAFGPSVRSYVLKINTTGSMMDVMKEKKALKNLMQKSKQSPLQKVKPSGYQGILPHKKE